MSGLIMYFIGSEWLSLLALRNIIQCRYTIGTKPLPYLICVIIMTWFVHPYLSIIYELKQGYYLNVKGIFHSITFFGPRPVIVFHIPTL